ncbi:MAG TPA: ABC transporter ATP-binding protein/permease [Geminicoccaceae bacterium]|nr:ABC transporter ATP-binding protein/permease [Geminicoccus sp.]HMU50159.1 ABC transporter ATP-binding protein/permease [Geminicoccaceae bacterium]
MSADATGWREVARLVLPHLWPRDEPRLRRRVLVAVGFLVAAKLVNISVPFFLKAVVDGLAVQGLAAVPLAALLAYGAARLGASLFMELRDAVFANVAQRAGRVIARDLYAHLFDLSLRYHLQRRTGELSRAIERGVRAVGFLLQTALFSLVPTILELVLVLGILLWRYPPSFAVTIFLTIAAYAAFTIVTTNWRARFRREMNERDNQLSGQAVDGLINFEMVKAFTNEAHETARLDRSLEGYEKAAVRSESSLAALNAGQAAIIAVGVTLVMWQAARGVIAGSLTVGDVVLVNAFVLQLYLPLSFLGVMYRELKQSLIDLENVGALRRLAPEVRDAAGAPALRLAGGEVRFERVRFAYDERRPILEDVGFTIPAGRKLAVVGPSGSGKSTLVRLLFRFYDVQDGAVRIDGQDVRDVTQHSLRRAVGVVPQDTVLFNDTIAANIGYGRPDASQSEIEQAARMAQIHDLVASLPEGYATLVGERGLKLSGGEKQRVAMARVLLKDPPLLVLDEATSALDSRTEQALQGALQRVASGRTTLVIAHRLSTVVDADEIVVLSGGRVVERGDHAALLAFGGLYAEMWLRQQERAERPAAQPDGPSAMPSAMRSST